MSSRRRTRRDYETLIAAFERSGLSLNAFARKKGVPYSTLALWKNRLAKEAEAEPADAPPQFLPVRGPDHRRSVNWCAVAGIGAV